MLSGDGVGSARWGGREREPASCVDRPLAVELWPPILCGAPSLRALHARRLTCLLGASPVRGAYHFISFHLISNFATGSKSPPDQADYLLKQDLSLLHFPIRARYASACAALGHII